MRANPSDNARKSRVEAWERNVEFMNKRITLVQTGLEQRVREGSRALQKEKEVRKKQDGRIRGLLEATETGGLDISMIGLVWLLSGVLVCSFSQELANVLG